MSSGALLEAAAPHDDLLAALRARDPAVARPLWQQFAPAVFRMLRHTPGPQAHVDDAVQVVLLRVYRRGRRLPPRSDLGPLVMETTARIARAELRRRTSRWRLWRWRAPAARQRQTDGPSDREGEAVARFYRILDRLSAADRVAFVLRYLEGLEVREIAAATGASAARTVRRLRRGVGKVVAGIEEAPALEPPPAADQRRC